MSKVIKSLRRNNEDILLQKKQIDGLETDLLVLSNSVDTLLARVKSIDDYKLPTYAKASTTQDGLMSAADKKKLDSIEDGAQVNASISAQGTYSNATTTSAGLMSAADKVKLNGIATGAQVNSVTGVKGNGETTYRTGNINLTPANIGISNANNNTAGLMSANDFTKLQGIANGAQVNSVTGVKGSAESNYRTGNVNITAANLGISNATTSSAGFMSSADKSKLDGIAAGATVETCPFNYYSAVNFNEIITPGIYLNRKGAANAPDSNNDYLMIVVANGSVSCYQLVFALTNQNNTNTTIFKYRYGYKSNSVWTWYSWHDQYYGQ